MILLIVFGEYTKYKQRKTQIMGDVKIEQESVLEEVKMDNKPNIDYRKDVIDFMNGTCDGKLLLMINFGLKCDFEYEHKILHDTREYKLSLLN